MVQKNRRDVLKSIGAASIGAAVIGQAATSAVAYTNDQYDEIGHLIVNGREHEAEELMESEGINYSSTSGNTIYNGDADLVNDAGELDPSEDNIYKDSNENSPGEIGTNTYKSPGGDSNTNNYLALTEREDNVYDVFYQWHLDPRTKWKDVVNQYNGCGSDAAGVFWNTEYFNSPSVGRSNFRDFDQDRVDYAEWHPRGGVAAKVNDPSVNESVFKATVPDWTAGFGTTIEAVREGAEKEQIIGQYEHTWVGALTPCVGVSVGISLGPMSVAADGTPYSWKMPASAKIPHPVE